MKPQITIPIPDRMKRLKLDARGFPIPVIVYTDAGGKSHFAINDPAKRERVIARDLCGICGGELLRGRWFVGGPLCAFDDHGAYLDPPMHNECAHYALQVCPYLAAPSYAHRVDAATVGEDHPIVVLQDTTMLPGRPPVFVAVMSRKAGQRLIRREIGDTIIRPARPYISVEYWRQGRKLTEAEARPDVEAALRADLPAELPMARLFVAGGPRRRSGRVGAGRPETGASEAPRPGAGHSDEGV